MNEHEVLSIEWVAVDQLHCNPSNPRKNAKAVPHVAASLKRFGWRQPLVVKRGGEVIAGNTRLKAAKVLELKNVPVVWFDGSEHDATAYSIADNRTAEFASWDKQALAPLLQELRAEDSLDAVGFTDGEIDELLAELEPDGGDAEDSGPEAPPKQPVTRPGDLWLLGKHRLLCGDATKGDDVARVMDGAKASLLVTDPPYCVNYTGADRPQNSGKDWSALYRETEIEDLGEFLSCMFETVLPHLEEVVGIYIWHAHVQYPVLHRVFDKFGIIQHQPIIWVKPTSTLTFSYYRWAHETCLFGWRRGHKPCHYLPNGLTTVWEADWEGKQRLVGNEHPTQKPLRLFEIPMEQHTKRGALILEPFCGSGSQLIAAEKLHRRCRAIEISPAFVDVAVRRWEKATTQQATLLGTNKTFSQTAEERRDKPAPEPDDDRTLPLS